MILTRLLPIPTPSHQKSPTMAGLLNLITLIFSG